MNASVRTRQGWLLVPGTVILSFAVASILLPVGSDGLGAGLGHQPGFGPSLARWSRDLHDGFWCRPGLVLSRTAVPVRPAEGERALARQLCRRGEAEQAVAIYQRIGVVESADHDAVWELASWLILNGQYDRAERYAREADILVGGGTFRNNLAWHYTQTNQRPSQALALALSSVTANREACSVDTLAWAFYRNGRLADARQTARETLAFDDGGLAPFLVYERQQAKDSSRRLLTLLDQPTRDPFAGR